MAMVTGPFSQLGNALGNMTAGGLGQVGYGQQYWPQQQAYNDPEAYQRWVQAMMGQQQLAQYDWATKTVSVQPVRETKIKEGDFVTNAYWLESRVDEVRKVGRSQLN